MDKEPTVFILDDDPAVRQALTLLIRSMQLRVEDFESAQQFLDRFDRNQPGCLLLDVRMPGISGMEVLDRFRQEDILLADHCHVGLWRRADGRPRHESRALNFLEKPWRDQQLWEAIHEAISWDATHRHKLTARAKVLRRLGRLTSGERIVLQLLIDGRSNKSIAEQLKLSVRTIEVRRAKVMKKMKAESLAELIRLTLDADAHFAEPQPER